MQMIVVQLINHHFEACSPFIFEKKKKVKIGIHLCYHYRKNDCIGCVLAKLQMCAYDIWPQWTGKQRGEKISRYLDVDLYLCETGHSQ